ncbi:MAG: beta-ketoacyl-ACP synthase II [Phycisphaeraceae bacterium]
MTGRPRVVITGIGWVTPLGCDIDTTWKRLLNGESGARPIETFDGSTLATSFAAQVQNFDPTPLLKTTDRQGPLSRYAGFALGAAAMAWQNARLDDATSLDRDRVGIYLGAGEAPPDFDNYVASNLAGWNPESRAIDAKAWAQAATQRMQPAPEMDQETGLTLTRLAMEFNTRGPSSSCLTACAASTQAIGEALDLIRQGHADVMLAGGAHTMIHPLGMTGFIRLTAMSTRNDDPKAASRPFAADRDGFVMGEGAGMLILETEQHAKARNATILAEVAGYGSTADAYRLTDIHPEGRGAAQAMNNALADANAKPQDIDYISAHGTSTKENDATETTAVKVVFGEHAKNIPISSAKSMIGHLIAAAGAVEAITCILALRDGVLPPTINLNTPDPDCDLDYIPNHARQASVNLCMSNSFGFGGQNDSLILRKPSS